MRERERVRVRVRELKRIPDDARRQALGPRRPPTATHGGSGAGHEIGKPQLGPAVHGPVLSRG